VRQAFGFSDGLAQFVPIRVGLAEVDLAGKLDPGFVGAFGELNRLDQCGRFTSILPCRCEALPLAAGLAYYLWAYVAFYEQGGNSK
jgi:hypothetical protein